MQSASSRIWTHVAVSISYDNNDCATSTSKVCVYLYVYYGTKGGVFEVMVIVTERLESKSTPGKIAEYSSVSLEMLIILLFGRFLFFLGFLVLWASLQVSEKLFKVCHSWWVLLSFNAFLFFFNSLILLFELCVSKQQYLFTFIKSVFWLRLADQFEILNR